MNNSKTEQLYAFRSGSDNKTPGLTKFATLSPYIAQIQKRKKARSVLRDNRSKSKNQSSSKSFRIKDRSTSSLKGQYKKQLNNKTIANIINKINSKKKQQSSRSKIILTEKEKSHVPSSTCTIKSNVGRIPSRIDGDDAGDKKNRKDISFRRNKFESRSRNQMTLSNDQNQHKKTIQVTKYGYTDTNRTVIKKQQTITLNPKINDNLYGVGKKKFRRGKYEALYSSVNSNQIPHENNDQPTKSQSQLQIAKKQSNISINKEVDLMAEKQMQRFYRQMRSKQIRKSLKKSTQYYFKHDSAYRAPKSNNDIEIYVSTVKNPSLNRQSNASTLYTSQKQQPEPSTNTFGVKTARQKQNHLLGYDFDFKENQQQTNNILGITQIQNPSQQESMGFNVQQQTSFEKQRKQVQREYFHKKSPQIDWSDDDCQIDEL